METTRTSQTKLPAGECKDNSASWRLLADVAHLASDSGQIQQRDRFHGESSICLSKHFTALRVNRIRLSTGGLFTGESDPVVADCLALPN